jgi:UDP:flavonoid glycosyltransferase YjiC (YdhE family)
MLDQRMVGQSVERAGAGRLVSKRTSAGDLRTVVADLLADGPHRPAAARLGEQIRAMPGAVNGADQVEALLRNGATAPDRRAARP